MSHSSSVSKRCFITITMTLFLLLVTTTKATLPDQNGQRIFPSQFLIPQNAARLALGMRPLVWSAKLARYAQRYANQRSNDCALQHSNGRYGENIFWGGGAGWTPAQAVKAWVEEVKWYNHDHNSCAEGQMCGHYTQIVWNGTRKVGCASVTCSGDRGTFITCNYHPPGNYIGEKPY